MHLVFEKHLKSFTLTLTVRDVGAVKQYGVIYCHVHYVQYGQEIINYLYALLVWTVYSNKLVSMVSQGWLECPNQNQYFSIDYVCFVVSCLDGSTVKYFNLQMVSGLYDYFFKYLLCLKHTSVF